MLKYIGKVSVGTIFVGTDVFEIAFISSVISSQVITELPTILAKYCPFLQLHVAGFQKYIFCTHDVLLHFYTHIRIYCYSNFYFNYILYHIKKLHLNSHDMCFVNIFDSFLPVTMLKKLRFESYVLFGAHTTLNRSSREF